MTLYDVLQQKFDIAKILTLSHRKDRRDMIEKQLQILGIPLGGFLDYHYTTSFPFNDIIMNAFNRTNRGKFTKPNEYDCARSHYSIVKTCYDLGYKHCLIIEDDVKFLKDSSIFMYFLNKIPDDYDILQFGGFTVDKNATKILDEYINGKYWVQHPNIFLWNASMYALSRKGMQYYIEFMNKVFTVADMPLYKAPLNKSIINAYICTLPLVIQANKNEIYSDIRNKDNDSINYETDNMYESRVNASDYL